MSLEKYKYAAYLKAQQSKFEIDSTIDGIRRYVLDELKDAYGWRYFKEKELVIGEYAYEIINSSFSLWRDEARVDFYFALKESQAKGKKLDNLKKMKDILLKDEQWPSWYHSLRYNPKLIEQKWFRFSIEEILRTQTIPLLYMNLQSISEE